MPVAEPVLTLDTVSIQYGGLTVVSDVSFEVREGEFVTLLGPSGSGKTSLLRAIAGFVQPSTGSVLLHGDRMNDVPPYERDVGMVFQNYALFPHMTVAENLQFGLRMSGLPRSDIERRTDEALGYVRLGDLRKRYPHQLSGGQQQRVAIARAIAIQPSVLLLDEPMSNLDARLRADMRYELLGLLDRIRITTVSVTHNQEEALAMSDRVIVMAEGRIRQVGTPSDIYNMPIDPFVADFIGDANVLHCRQVGNENGWAKLETDWGDALYAPLPSRPSNDILTVLIRPELIGIGNGGEHCGTNRLLGRLTQVGYMGAVLEFRVAVNEHEFRVKRPAGSSERALSIGDTVTLWWEPSAMVALERT